MRDDLGYFDDETGDRITAERIDGDRRVGVSQEHNSSNDVDPFLNDVLRGAAIGRRESARTAFAIRSHIASLGEATRESRGWLARATV